MKPRTRVTIVAALVIAGFVLLVVGRMSNRPPRVEPTAFSREVDLTPLAESAVHARGRLKSFHSFADMMVGAVAGPLFSTYLVPFEVTSLLLLAATRRRRARGA